MLETHFSDEQLLRHLDGELPLRADKAVRKHLKTCWKCRCRLAELEQQIHCVAKELEEASFPGPDWILDARNRFSFWEDWFERSFMPAPQLRLNSGVFERKRVPIGAMALLLIMAGMALWTRTRTQPPPSPREALVITQKAESVLYRKSIHQAFRVEVAQLKPLARRRSSRLELWSEVESNRFSSKLRESDGTLKHALWRPEEKQEFVYDPAMAEGVAKRIERSPRPASVTEVAQYGLNLEQLEVGFIRWLETRFWRPISFASDLAVFASQDGVILEAEPTQTQDGRKGLRLSARRRTAYMTVELVVESDSYEGRPRLQRIRFETPDRVVELSLIAEQTEFYEPAHLVSAVFRPDRPVVDVERTSPRIAQPASSNHPLEARVRPEMSVAPAADPYELAAKEIEVRYALHRARACLGEPIEVLRDGEGHIFIRGLSETASRKAELLTALQELGAESVVRIDIRTVEEEEGSQPADTTAISRSSQSTQIRPERLPIQALLEEYFARHSGLDSQRLKHQQAAADHISQSITELSNRAITMAEATLMESWALRRLAQRYRSQDLRQLRPQTRWLLEAMVLEHVSRLAGETRRAHELLRPILESITTDQAALDSGAPADVQAAFEDAAGTRSSWDSLLALFDKVERIDALTRGLFAGAGLPTNVQGYSDDGAPSIVRITEPEQASRDLVAGLEQIEVAFENLELQLATEFSSGPELVTSKEQLEQHNQQGNH